jgi:hypothetical protein
LLIYAIFADGGPGPHHRMLVEDPEVYGISPRSEDKVIRTKSLSKNEPVMIYLDVPR